MFDPKYDPELKAAREFYRQLNPNDGPSKALEDVVEIIRKIRDKAERPLSDYGDRVTLTYRGQQANIPSWMFCLWDRRLAEYESRDRQRWVENHTPVRWEVPSLAYGPAPAVKVYDIIRAAVEGEMKLLTERQWIARVELLTRLSLVIGKDLDEKVKDAFNFITPFIQPTHQEVEKAAYLLWEEASKNGPLSSWQTDQHFWLHAEYDLRQKKLGEFRRRLGL